MRVRILPSSPDQPEELQFLTSFLIDDRVAVDAGCLGVLGGPREQAAIRTVLLTHSHVDHVATLPIYLENALRRGEDPATVYGSPETLDALRRHMFNGLLWPTLARLGNGIVLRELEPEQPVELAGLRVTPVPVDHTVPAYGYVVEDETSAVVFGADSRPTGRLWEVARNAGNLAAVFIECSFPERMREHADLVAHLTPSLVREEIRKLDRDVDVVAVHLKPRYRAEIVAELNALGMERLHIGRGGAVYPA